MKTRTAAAAGRQDNYPRAAALTLASALLFAAAGAMVKHVSADLPNTMVVFFRNLFGMVLLMPWLMKRGLGALRTQHLRLHLLRGALGLGAMYCYFFAIAHLTLADAVLLNYAAPLYVPFMAALWLREPVPATLRWAVPVGFLGVALILKPSQGLLQLSALVGWAAGVCTALSFVTLRQMSATEPAARTVFYFATLATAVSGIPLLWSWQTPDPSLWLGLLLTGFFASSGQLLLTRGYYYAPASRVGPLTYMVVVFAAGLGWGFWDEIPDRWSLFGALLVCVAGVMAMRERRPVRP